MVIGANININVEKVVGTYIPKMNKIAVQNVVVPANDLGVYKDTEGI